MGEGPARIGLFRKKRNAPDRRFVARFLHGL
jgi:hypothetical protein